MSAGPVTARSGDAPSVKCLVWDLDHTLWDGVLLEDSRVTLRPEALQVVRTLDERGILHSIASRNDHDTAMAKLAEFGLADYFLYPQINWNSKSSSVAAIATALSLSPDSFAFIDDQPFERDEVLSQLPQVLAIDARDLALVPAMERMNPRFITAESKLRRRMYLSDVRRREAEEHFNGASEKFLETLGMVFTIAPVREDDLQRAEELTIRTHQLNTTGYTYSYEELEALSRSPDHLLLAATLDDCYGTYGKIGLALVALGRDAWTIKLLLMSCRVMARGVGTVMLSYLMKRARQANVRLLAEFVSNERNRMMYITYKFAGFREVNGPGGVTLLENDLERIQNFPPYIDVRILDEGAPASKQMHA